MKLKKLLIAGGNSTLLVWDCPSGEKNNVINKYLGEVEQVGFVEEKNGLPFLNMMGEELCINGTIALASLLGKKGKIYTSGVSSPVLYRNARKETAIGIRLSYTKIDSTILFEGIGFIYLQKEEKNYKQLLAKLAKKYSLPAFGAILYKNNKLVPYVYVVQTDSLFLETACGSGSIALSILTKKETITQPTGQNIFVKKYNKNFLIRTKVRKYE